MADVVQRLGGFRSELAYKAPCRVATTGPITRNGYQTIDGVVLAASDLANGLNLRVLVKDQTDQTQNGVYVFGTGDWVRAIDMDGNGDFVQGTRVYVLGGTVGSTAYVVTTQDPIVIGTSAITFVTEASLLGAGLEYVIDGGGSYIPTGIAGPYFEVPFKCRVASVKLLADAAGSIVVDIWKCTTAQFDGGATHPVAGDSITASDQPTLSSAAISTDSALTGWTTLFSKGDILAYNVVSTSSQIKRLTVSLTVTRLS